MERTITAADRRLSGDEMDPLADDGTDLDHASTCGALTHAPTDDGPQAGDVRMTVRGEWPHTVATPATHNGAAFWRGPPVALGPPNARSVILGAGGATVYFVLAYLSLALSSFDNTLATVWLPSAAAVAFLLHARLTNELAFYAVMLPASALANYLNGTPLPISLVFTLANMTCVAMVTWLTRRSCGPSPDMRDLPTLVRFVWSAGFVGPLIAASIGAMAMGSGTGGMIDFAQPGEADRVLQGAIGWFLTESMGMVLIVPTALMISDALADRRWPNAQTLGEGAVLLACSFACAMFVFGQAPYPVLFLIMPMTLIHAFRLGSVGTALHIGLIAAVASVMTWAGFGPIVEADASPAANAHLIQAFIAANLLTGLPICAILAGRERLTEALDEGRRELALLANSITDAVLKLDGNGVCTYASPAVRDVLGEEPSAFIGRRLETLTQEDASQRITDALSRLLDGESEKERLTYRRRLDDSDGLPVFIEADCAIPCDPATGAKEGIIVSARDVTERVELELLLTRARRHAEKAAGAKSDFLANMSHEIRTPMNGVLGFAELMLQGDLDPDQRRHTEMIVESGRSMMLLLNDILDLSKIEAGQIVIDTGPIDLHATLDECVALHRQAAKKKGVSLRLEYEWEEASDPLAPSAKVHEACGNLLPTVITDGLRLRQIALNLIGNAVKFTQEGEVRISYWARENELCVRVRDTGIGISPNKLDKIFSPFTQGDSEIAQRFGGTGLGLSISRQLAELLGGRIAVDSVPGVGSTFTLSLPATLIEPADMPTNLTSPILPEDLPQHARILLVEDHDVNRMLVTEMLERCGQSVAIAQDGNEAISMVMDSVMRARPFDLILMDVQMPDCDGYQATLAIRDEGIGPETLPIIALTANAFPEDVAAAREAGMQAHLAKPIKFADLARALQRWLPTRIVEAPMDRDVPIQDAEDRANVDGADPLDDGSKSTLQQLWLARRGEVIEAVRKGLSDGLIGYQNKRRAKDSEDREILIRMVHKLAGTAASFGEPELGQSAIALERAMTQPEPSADCEALAFALLALADEPLDARPASSEA